MKQPLHVNIKASGIYIPQNKLSNFDLEKKVDTTDEWIKVRTGIESRFIASEAESVDFMAFKAASEALKNSKLHASDIDLLIVATSTASPFPATAALVQAQLKLNSIAAFDVQMACSGFVYALEIANCMLLHGSYKNALVIGVDKMSSLVDWQDRSTCILFGDGAGAFLLSKETNKELSIEHTSLFSDGSQSHILTAHPNNHELKPIVQMNGKELFKWAVRVVSTTIQDVLKFNNLDKQQIDWIIPHQANIRIIQSISEHLEIPISKFVCNLQKYGNTSAASIPIALHEAIEDGRIQKGQKILLIGFGAGLSWGTCLIN